MQEARFLQGRRLDESITEELLMRAPLFLVEVAAASCGTAPLKPCLKFRDKGTGRAANAGAISLNAGHTCITPTVQTEFFLRLTPLCNSLTVKRDLAVTTPRLLDTVLREAGRHDPATATTLAYAAGADLDIPFGRCRGISNKGKHGRDENSGCSTEFGSRRDAL